LTLAKRAEDKVAKSSKASETKTVKLAGDLRIAGAAAAFGALRSAAQARQVEKLDAAGLQALLAGCQALGRAGKLVSWVGCSAQLTAAAGLLGLAEGLELPR
jgi:anti-anti-sigma regulatory factor